MKSQWDGGYKRWYSEGQGRGLKRVDHGEQIYSRKQEPGEVGTEPEMTTEASSEVKGCQRLCEIKENKKTGNVSSHRRRYCFLWIERALVKGQMVLFETLNTRLLI